MLALEKWAEGKPPLLAIFSIQLATATQDVLLGFQTLKEREIRGTKFPMPKLSEWFRFYRSHHAYFSFIEDAHRDYSDASSKMVEFSKDLLGALKIILPLSPEERLELFRQTDSETREEIEARIRSDLKENLQATLLEIREEISGQPIDKQDSERFLAKFLTPEGCFYLFAYMPCFMLCKDYPTRLYRKARQGNLKALEKLLLVDASLIHDPSIGRVLTRLTHDWKWSAYRHLLEACEKSPGRTLDIKTFKKNVAGLISLCSSIFKQPLKEPDIRALFDAASQDYFGENIDRDIPDSQEAFSKAIQRYKKEWKDNLLNPDKKN